MSESYWGVWHEEPGVWTGWFGFAAGGVFIPTRFAKEEAETRAALSPFTEARIIPEDQREILWNEDAWRKAKA